MRVVRKRKKSHQLPTFLAGNSISKRKNPCFPNVYKIVNVNCRLPSSTGLIKKSKASTEVVTEFKSAEDLHRNEDENVTKDNNNLNNDKPKVPVITKKRSNKKVAEKAKISKPDDIENLVGFQINPKTNEIVSDAHRMIWFWLFNGLFPTNINKKKSGMQLNK